RYDLARNLNGFRIFNAPFARQTNVLFYERNIAATEEITTLSSHRKHLDSLPLVVAHESLRSLNQVCIERSREALVRSTQDDQVTIVAARIETWVMKILVSARSQVA